MSMNDQGILRRLHPALCFRFFVAGARIQQARQILVHRRSAQRARQVPRGVEPGENRVHYLGPGDTPLPVATRNVARPKPDVIKSGSFFHAEINDGMAVLGPANFRRPKNLHEIAWLRMGEIVEIFSEVHLMEEPRSPRTVGVPAAPDAFAVALVANEQTFERREIQTQSAARAQRFDGLDENQIGGARTVARGSRIGHDGKNARFKMGGGLEPDGRGAGSGISSTRWHRPDLVEDKIIVFARGDLGAAQISRAEGQDKADDDFREVTFQNYAVTNRTRMLLQQPGAAIFNRRLSRICVIEAPSP